MISSDLSEKIGNGTPRFSTYPKLIIPDVFPETVSFVKSYKNEPIQSKAATLKKSYSSHWMKSSKSLYHKIIDLNNSEDLKVLCFLLKFYSILNVGF